MKHEEKVNEFAKRHGIKLRVIGTPEYKKYFPEDLSPRYVFKMCLSRHGRRYTFTFVKSYANGKVPTMYEVLHSLTKSDPGSFQEFCYSLGYDADSITANRIYKKCCREYAAVKRLFGDLLYMKFEF
jgi:hypothetical protein